MWYDVNSTLSHNCLLNFVVGPRGVGKTYSCKNRVIRNFLRKGEQFVYLRRYETEIKKDKIEKFFDDIEYCYSDHGFAVKDGKFYIDGKVAGYYLPLSKASQVKSVPYPQVSMIIFDEFIIDQGMIRYLPNEVITFNEMYSTIARLRDVTVLFLSNAITFTNPYFLFFDLSLQQGQKIVKKGDILLELVDSPDYTRAASETRFGKIIQGTDYGKYAIENSFLRDTDTFIEKMSGPGTYLFTIRVNDESFGVYYLNEFWYISNSVDNTCKKIMSLDIMSHDDATTLNRESVMKRWFIELQQKYFRAEVRFTTQKAKNLISPMLRKV